MTALARCGCLLWLLATGVARADGCPSWEEWLAEESISTVGIGAIGPGLGMSIAFVYLNPRPLGECVLGADVYAELLTGTLKDPVETHAFWVAASGPYASAFKAKDHYLVQGDSKLELKALRRNVAAQTIAGAPEIKVQYLVFFQGELDFRDPVTIFFQRGDGTYGTEYWLDEKYRP
jgi:hypothetical protein